MQCAGPQPPSTGPVVSLVPERARVDELLDEARGEYVDLAIAAASLFHHVYRSPQDALPRRDYEVALNIAAAALSRLLIVYTLENPDAERVAISRGQLGRFASGATEMNCQDGRRIERLSVRRSEMLSAISFIGRAGLDLELDLD